MSRDGIHRGDAIYIIYLRLKDWGLKEGQQNLAYDGNAGVLVADHSGIQGRENRSGYGQGKRTSERK